MYKITNQKKYISNYLSQVEDKLHLDRFSYKVFIFLVLWVAGTYLLPNKIQIFELWQVPYTFIDEYIGLSINWIWAYISYYIFIFSAYIFAKTSFTRRLVFFSFFSSCAASTICFFLFPTSIPRDLYPIEPIDSISKVVLSFIREADTSINCIPSMHVALSLMAVLSTAQASRKYGFIYFIWFLIICYSTMATKQHYFYDVVGGFVFGGFFWIVSYYYLLHIDSKIKAGNVD